MTDFTKQLINSETFTPNQIPPNEAVQTFRELKMLMKLGYKKKVFNSNTMGFLLNAHKFGFQEALANNLPRNNSYNELSYSEVKQKLIDLIAFMLDDMDNINFDTISTYNDYVYRNNDIVQSLLDLSGELHPYHEGEQIKNYDLI